LAERGPTAVGVKLTAITQFAPASTVEPQGLLLVGRAKSPEFVPVSEMPEIFSVDPPVLVRVTFWVALVVPVFCPAKVSEVRLSETTGGDTGV
jgi:hypothetical protein